MISIAAGPSQLIAALCDESGLEKKINESVDRHPSYWKVTPGTHIKALIINILCSRTPRYRVEEFYEQLDVELLFGSGRKASDFNDDALARTLDVLYEAEGWKVYSGLALASLKHLGLPLTTFHNDTRSFSMYCDYPDTEELADHPWL
ncbi:DUF4277 domain-containing protein [Cohnella silvisoli]|uniref:DUF4277 domain-containing protein n=1 Tax=Cohnella silvisoli TaxID=2873699 RepID=A0ABV1L3H8_9BACL|nr:DUF4277 domain-containing protein [Cohnella silvisoli]MCD9026193.1 DUF4277 domain-containing protein [Cohnella silvisoli]